MKSAYELAMERLDAEAPESKPLTDQQKAQLGEIDEKYKAKIAEREIFLKQKLVTAESQGDMHGALDIKKQLGNERTRLEEEREHQKDKIREA
tara:strand:- start:160 stop:438 length:279 start_codon:yes stop_codon:yes gene_type:complete